MVTFLHPTTTNNNNNKNHHIHNHNGNDNHHTLPKRFPTPPPSVSMSAVDVHDYCHDDNNELSEYCEPNH